MMKPLHPILIFTVSLLGITAYICLIPLSPKVNNVNWTAIGSIATFLTAVFAAYTAYMAKKTIEAGFKPIVSIEGIDSEYYEEFGCSVKLILKNHGKGPANVLVLDMESNINKGECVNLIGHIGWPINIGNGGTGHIRIWVPDPTESYEIKMALYYWDIQDKCYCSEYHVYIRYQLILSGYDGPDLNVDRDRMVEISNIDNRPIQPLHWPRDEYYYRRKPWWQAEEEWMT